MYVFRRVSISTKAKQPLIKASAHTNFFGSFFSATNMPTRSIVCWVLKKNKQQVSLQSVSMKSFKRSLALASCKYNTNFMIVDDMPELESSAHMQSVYVGLCVVWLLPPSRRLSECVSSRADTENDEKKSCNCKFVALLHIKSSRLCCTWQSRGMS